MSKKLTAKEEAFCQQYLIDLNGTQASIRAGYSRKSATAIGYENLRKPHIVDRISILQKQLAERNGISPDDIIRELRPIVFSNIRDFVDEDNQIRQISQIDEDKLPAVQSIKVTQTTVGELGIKTTTELKFHDKLNAIDKMAKHIGFYEQHNQQKNKVVIDQVNFRIKKRTSE